MHVVFFSKTNNIKRFVNKSSIVCIEGHEKLVLNEPYVLLCYTTGFGEVPVEVDQFLNNANNHQHLQGVIGSGNKNWGINYCKAVDKIAEKYLTTVLMKFELAGNKHDVTKFNQLIRSMNA